jgi:hypothetical protein
MMYLIGRIKCFFGSHVANKHDLRFYSENEHAIQYQCICCEKWVIEKKANGKKN